MDSSDSERRKGRSEARIIVVSVLAALGLSSIYQGLVSTIFKDPQTIAAAQVWEGVAFIVVAAITMRAWGRAG